MKIREELLRLLVENDKWRDDTSTYINEFHVMLLKKSQAHITTEDLPHLSPEEIEEMKRFANYIKREFKALHRPRSIEKFCQNHTKFLEKPFMEVYMDRFTKAAKENVGRPQIPFEDLSDRGKRKRTAPIREGNSPEEIISAARSTLFTEGSRISAELMDNMLSSPGRPKKMKNALEAKSCIPYTADEALAYIIDTKLSKNQYMKTRIGAKKRRANIYPAYSHILDAKKMCYPEDISITEYKAEVPLQKLLNHTIKRILIVQEPVLANVASEPKSLVLESKWGFDSATGQHLYQQPTTQNEEGTDENSLLVTNLVPLRLYYKDNPSRLLWKNPVPNSTRYCRQIRFQYKKETADVSCQEKEAVEHEIKNLQPYQQDHTSGRLEVSFKMHFTMIDGKVHSAITQTASAASCPTCGATPSQMNNLSLIQKKEVNVESLLMGMTPMHMYIRCFEMLIHISIRLVLPTPTWQIKGTHNQSIAKNRKDYLRKIFKKEWGMTILTPNRGGSGNTHTGNMARRMFKDPNKAAGLLNIEEALIRRFSVLLSAINSGYAIDPIKFNEYCLTTFENYVSLYPWFYMPQSIHRLLIHSKDALEALGGLTLGETSEECQESRNKDHLFAREHCTRKMSRTFTNEDQMHYMMVTSDPVISSLRSPTSNHRVSVGKEVLDLLIAHEPTQDKESDTVFQDLEDPTDTETEDEEEFHQQMEIVDEEDELEYDDTDVTLPIYYHSEYDVEFGKLRIEDLEDSDD